MPSLGGSGEYGGSDVSGSSTSSSGLGGETRQSGLGYAQSDMQSIAQGDWSTGGWFSSGRTPTAVYDLPSAGRYGSQLGAEMAQRQAAESAARKEEERRAAAKKAREDRIAAQNAYAQKEYHDQVVAQLGKDFSPSAYNQKMSELAYDKAVSALARGDVPNEFDFDLAATHLGEDRLGELTDAVNLSVQAERGLLGQTFDFFTGREDEIDPEGYSRAMSVDAVKQQAKQGTLSTAMKGLSQGLLQTDKQGQLTDDKWGQFTEIADTAALMLSPLVAGQFVGGVFGQAFREAAPQMAGEMLVPGTPGVGAVTAAYDTDPLSLLSSFSGAAAPIADAYAIGQMRSMVGLPEHYAEQSFGEEAGDSDVVRGLPPVASATQETTPIEESASSVYTNLLASQSGGGYSRPQSRYNPYAYNSFNFSFF